MKIKLMLLFVVVSCGGCLYTDIKFPLDRDLHNTELGSKVGRSTAHSVAWLVAWGDAGTARAAEDGGITNIKHLDQRIYSILFGLYSKSETIAYGD